MNIHKYIFEDNKIKDVTYLATFKIDILNKEYVMYSLESDINEILLGELIDENGIKKVVGVSSEDEDIVSLYFDEIIKEMNR